jgi:hypothetical protein
MIGRLTIATSCFNHPSCPSSILTEQIFVTYRSRLSAVEADRFKVSKLLRGLQRLHSDCLRAQHDVGGDLACYNLDVDRAMAVTGHIARIWEVDNSVLSFD